MRVKFASGIFDAPFTSRDHLKRVDSEAARRLARAAAAEGVVLLTNHAAMGRGAMLPLPTGLRSVAVLGALGGCDPSVAPPIEGPPDLCLARMASRRTAARQRSQCQYRRRFRGEVEVETGMSEGFCEPLDEIDSDASGNTAPTGS